MEAAGVLHRAFVSRWQFPTCRVMGHIPVNWSLLTGSGCDHVRINVQMCTGCGLVALEDPSEASWVHTTIGVVLLGTNLLCILKKAAKYNCINKWRQQLPGVLEEVATSGNACWEGRLNSNEGNGFEMLPDRECLWVKCWQQTRARSHFWR